MITDDTILEKLQWREFERSGESYRIASEKCDSVIKYVFPEYTDRNNYYNKDGITITAWSPSENCSYNGIKMDFWAGYESRTQWRAVKFEGTAKEFKAKVLEKFEALKSLKQEVDAKYINQKHQEVADELEITRLTQIAKQAFEKYKVTISKSMAEYRLTLEIVFDDKRELLKFCDKGEHVPLGGGLNYDKC